MFLPALILLAGALSLPGLDPDLQKLLREKAGDFHEEAVRIRRDLHRIPETCYMEKETAAYVEKRLCDLNLEVRTGIGGYGIRAVLKGGRPGPVVGLRSDLDALPIPETTGLPFASRNAGNSHACGHDVHMANLLTAARILAEVREKISGTVVFLFQPCEEGTGGNEPGGAEKMIAAGVLENPHVDAMVGLHVFPGLPAGCVALRPGPLMANVDSVKITIKGKPSHGAYPHQGIDAIYAAATAIQEFQSLVSRRRDPGDPVVLSIGTIHGGVRMNVIAEQVEMAGTVRTFSLETQRMIREGMERILEGLKISQGIDYAFNFNEGSRFVKNDPAVTARLKTLFTGLLGEENVRDISPQTIGEDFSAYSHLVPSMFFFLGTGRDAALHTPKFDVDESILKTGPLLFAAAAIELLEGGNAHGETKKEG